MRDGVDRGPCFSYWGLSYRRKFVRTCWTVAAGLPVLALILVSGVVRWGTEMFRLPWEDRWGWWYIGGAAALGAAQAAYAYVRWQQTEPIAAEPPYAPSDLRKT